MLSKPVLARLSTRYISRGLSKEYQRETVRIPPGARWPRKILQASVV